MAQDLRTFMSELKNNGNEYLESTDRISANLGIPSFLEKLQKFNQFPAVLFTNVTTSKGLKSKYPVLSNLFASRSRLAKTIGTTPEMFAECMVQRTQAVPVQLVTKGEAPVKEIVHTGTEAGVGLLPIVTHHSGDAGDYITAGSVWCRDVDSGEYNCAMLRVWTRENNRFGIHLNPSGHTFFHYRRWAERQTPMPVIICIGHHPAFYLGTQAKCAGNEIEYIGGVMGEPLEVTPSETWGSDFLVPARAEIVLEGEILPGVLELEGPFGDFTGYTDQAKPHNVIELKAMTMRKDAIFLDVFAGHRDHFLIDAPMLENALLKQLRQVVPTVKKVHMPYSACCRFHAYIQMAKTNDGQPKTVIARALTSDFRLKHVIVVDSDIDVENEESVMWAVAMRSQWDRDIVVLAGVNGSVLDPSGENGITAKGGIDATESLKRKFPLRNVVARS